MDLAGPWRATVADDVLRRTFADVDLDDSDWSVLRVPGHWRASEAFATTDGPLLYRRSFEAGVPAAGRRTWLVFEGVFYLGDVWLDGSYLGTTEGYFNRQTFE